MLRPLVFLLLIIAGCSKKQHEQKPNILSLREMSDLATVEYVVTKIIKANDNKTWYKIGERKILISCEAHIKAGIDMSSISKNNFKIDGKDLQLQLPAPKIISLNIPAEKIKVEYQEISLFRDPFKTSDRDELAAQAEVQMINSIKELGILEQSKVNTSLFVNNFLVRLGYENINITYANAKTSIITQ